MSSDSGISKFSWYRTPVRLAQAVMYSCHLMLCALICHLCSSSTPPIRPCLLFFVVSFRVLNLFLMLPVFAIRPPPPTPPFSPSLSLSTMPMTSLVLRIESGTQSVVGVSGVTPFEWVWSWKPLPESLVCDRKKLLRLKLSLLLRCELLVSLSRLAGVELEVSPPDCDDSFFFPPKKLNRVPRCLSVIGWTAAASSTTPFPFASDVPIFARGGEFSTVGDVRLQVGEGVELASRLTGAGVKTAISGAKVDSKPMIVLVPYKHSSTLDDPTVTYVRTNPRSPWSGSGWSYERSSRDTS
jgi:hypothetical protein